MNNLSKAVLDEHRFPYENMSLEERNSYLNILKHCKDICDSIYPVNGERKCQLCEIRLKKNNNKISLNGFLNIGLLENRYIDGYIFIEDSNIIVDTHITRLSQNGTFEYTVFDEFQIVNGKLIRNSYYNSDMKKVTTEIDDEIMKGMIK